MKKSGMSMMLWSTCDPAESGTSLWNIPLCWDETSCLPFRGIVFSSREVTRVGSIWSSISMKKPFQRAPGFVKNKWPNFANRRWQEEVDVYYGVYVKPGDVQTRFGTSPDPVKWIEHLEMDRTSGTSLKDPERPRHQRQIRTSHGSGFGPGYRFRWRPYALWQCVVDGRNRKLLTAGMDR